MRPPLGRRHDAHRRRRRDLARLVPPLGHEVERQARQGSLPPRHGRPRRGLQRSRATPRHHAGQRAAALGRSEAGAVTLFPGASRPRIVSTIQTHESLSMKARVTVTLKTGVLDPQGKAIEGALKSLGIEGVDSVRQGKVFDIELSTSDRAQAETLLKAACEKLLANTVVENYRVEIV